MRKRIADIMEKLCVASLAVGIFQDKTYGIFIGLFFLAATLEMTRRLEK